MLAADRRSCSAFSADRESHVDAVRLPLHSYVQRRPREEIPDAILARFPRLQYRRLRNRAGVANTAPVDHVATLRASVVAILRGSMSAFRKLAPRQLCASWFQGGFTSGKLQRKTRPLLDRPSSGVLGAIPHAQRISPILAFDMGARPNVRGSWRAADRHSFEADGASVQARVVVADPDPSIDLIESARSASPSRTSRPRTAQCRPTAARRRPGRCYDGRPQADVTDADLVSLLKPTISRRE